MATFTIFDDFAENMSGGINLNTDTFKAYLTTTAPNHATMGVKADLTGEVANGNGYTTGGATLTTVTWAETSGGSGIWKFSSDDVTFTASGGDIATHQYLVIYSDTSTGDMLVGSVDRGSSAIIANGNSRTFDVGANGWFQLTVP